MQLEDTLLELFAPVVDEADAELLEVEFGGGNLLVTIDKSGGLDLATIQKVSRRLSLILDEKDPISQRFTLQVSSPGLERALKKPAHFARVVGEEISVSHRTDAGSVERVKGKLLANDDDSIELSVDELNLVVKHSAITKARTIFEWGPGPKPGSAKKKKASS